jgi:hypothetical protein
MLKSETISVAAGHAAPLLPPPPSGLGVPSLPPPQAPENSARPVSRVAVERRDRSVFVMVMGEGLSWFKVAIMMFNVCRPKSEISAGREISLPARAC